MANSLRDPILIKIHHKKRAGGVVQDVGPEFKPRPCTKKKRKLYFSPMRATIVCSVESDRKKTR
jgi:hypothetical protein